MTLHEFVQKYNMHDSFFEKIKYDPSKGIVQMLINFAFWLQDGYQEDTPETGLIEVKFSGVTEYMCSTEIDYEQFSILCTKETTKGVKFLLSNDATEDFAEITITASDVIVEVK